MGLLLLNDTSTSPHIGCQAVSDGHARLLGGGRVLHRHFVGGLREFWTGDEESSIAAVLASDLRREIEESDAVVVNGEGTMHHDAGLHYLAVLGAAQQLGRPTFLVNSIFQEIGHGHGVLKSLTDFVVRDGLSLENARALGIEARLEPDSLLAARWAAEPCIDFESAFVVTDWHPARHADVGRTMFAFYRKKGSSAFHYPFKHAVQRFAWRHAVANCQTARAVVTGRYHGMFVAGLAGVPFVALESNSHKMEALRRDSGLPLPVCVGARELDREIKAAMDNRSLFREFQEYLRGLGTPQPFKNLDGCQPAGESEPPGPDALGAGADRSLWILGSPELERVRKEMEAEAEAGAANPSRETRTQPNWRSLFGGGKR